jgi:tRNA(Ile)-lysidine synthase
VDRTARSSVGSRRLIVAPPAAGRVGAELLCRCTFPEPGTAVDCAVSGGADSLALMVLAVAAGCSTTVIHVDHGLRVGSAAEADVVAAAADRFGAHFRTERVVVSDGPNLEARARRARYQALPPGVLTGHTADDQAETILVNLMRGAGVDGMAGIRPHRRPLLHLRRTETAQLCRSLGLAPILDPMNADRRFARVRIRAELIPLLNDIAERDVVPVLARQAQNFRDLSELLEGLAEGLDPTDAKAVAAAPKAMAAVSLRQWLRAETRAEHPVDTASIERVVLVATGGIDATEINGGHRVARTRQRLRVERASPTES